VFMLNLILLITHTIREVREKKSTVQVFERHYRFQPFLPVSV